MPDNRRQDQRSPPSLGTWVFVGFALIAGFFLLTEHQVSTEDTHGTH